MELLTTGGDEVVLEVSTGSLSSLGVSGAAATATNSLRSDPSTSLIRFSKSVERGWWFTGRHSHSVWLDRVTVSIERVMLRKIAKKKS